jgi:Tfp pilus assembly protein PilO
LTGQRFWGYDMDRAVKDELCASFPSIDEKVRLALEIHYHAEHFEVPPHIKEGDTMKFEGFSPELIREWLPLPLPAPVKKYAILIGVVLCLLFSLELYQFFVYSAEVTHDRIRLDQMKMELNKTKHMVSDLEDYRQEHISMILRAKFLRVQVPETLNIEAMPAILNEWSRDSGVTVETTPFTQKEMKMYLSAMAEATFSGSREAIDGLMSKRNQLARLIIWGEPTDTDGGRRLSLTVFAIPPIAEDPPAANPTERDRSRVWLWPLTSWLSQARTTVDDQMIMLQNQLAKVQATYESMRNYESRKKEFDHILPIVGEIMKWKNPRR